MQKKPSLPLLLSIGGVVVVLLIGGILMVRSGSTKSTTDTSNVPTSQEAIPTVDPSVHVDLKGVNGNKEVMITVDGIPSGTETIDYELTYDAVGKGSQGGIGSLTLKENEKSFEKKITLGTCSSGTCIYYTLDSPITLSFKFTGSYGSKIFQKDYSL